MGLFTALFSGMILYDTNHEDYKHTIYTHYSFLYI